jgi:hypothetical protein
VAYREKDYLKRQMEMFAQLLARVLGLRAAGKPDEALEQMRLGAGAALGLEYDTLARVDPATARALLRDPELFDAYAQLLELEADVAAAVGDVARAEALRARAAAVRDVPAARDNAQ